MITSSPATRSSTCRKSAWWLTRWPAMTALPASPGIAVPGQWPGPLSSVASRMPSHIRADSPIAGMSIEPTVTRGSVVPSSAGGGCGTGRAALAAGIVGAVAVVAAVIALVVALVVGVGVGVEVEVGGEVVVVVDVEVDVDVVLVDVVGGTVVVA